MKAVAYVSPPADPEDLDIIAVVDERAGLARALQPIASGGAEALYVQRLNAAVGSLGELVRLLDWLAEAGGYLVADELDTRTATGRQSVALLREIERWGREPGPTRRPVGRPGLSAGSPALAERIATMRERGLSLAAIAAALNRESIPTPRGGTHWRPSSVQAALGYRRPRPPAPGAPPPKPAPAKPRSRDRTPKHRGRRPPQPPPKPRHPKRGPR